MSEKISVVCLSLLLVLSFFSCSHGSADAYASVLERSFSCKVSVERDDTQYSALVVLYARSDSEQSSHNRDGSIVYSSPESLSDITAYRTRGVVTVDVSGVIVTPSEKVGERYVSLLDMFDLDPRELVESRVDKTGERNMIRLSFFHSDKNYTLFLDESTGAPVLLEGDGLRVEISDFIYIA